MLHGLCCWYAVTHPLAAISLQVRAAGVPLQLSRGPLPTAPLASACHRVLWLGVYHEAHSPGTTARHPLCQLHPVLLPACSVYRPAYPASFGLDQVRTTQVPALRRKHALRVVARCD
jgi:hypothetical protein